MDLQPELFSLCDDGETGTLYITTTENRGCYVVIKDGQVISLSFGREGGDSFMRGFVQMNVKNFSFKQGLILPMSGKASISSSQDFLDILGYQMYKPRNEPSHTMDSNISQSGALVYRGASNELETDKELSFPENGGKSHAKVTHEAIPEHIRQEIEFEARLKEQNNFGWKTRPLAGT